MKRRRDLSQESETATSREHGNYSKRKRERNQSSEENENISISRFDRRLKRMRQLYGERKSIIKGE